MKGFCKLALAIVMVAVCFCLAVPTAKANGGFFQRRLSIRREASRQQAIRTLNRHHSQAIIVRQQHLLVAPLVAPVPQAIVVPSQPVIVQQPPAAIVVPQAFSVQSTFAY